VLIVVNRKVLSEIILLSVEIVLSVIKVLSEKIGNILCISQCRVLSRRVGSS
jgi:hypothetical protein